MAILIRLYWLVLVCAVLALQLCKTTLGAPTQREEKEQLDKRRLLSESYKRLFVHTIPVKPEEALELLQILETVYGTQAPSGTYETPIDTRKLIEYADVSDAKCSDLNTVVRMRADFVLIQSNYPALLPYIFEHFTQQFVVCGFDKKYKEDFEKFRQANPKRWAILDNFRKKVAKMGKISKNSKKDKLNNPVQLNEALSDIYQDKKEETGSKDKWSKHRGDAAIDTYNEARDIVTGSHAFQGQVSPSVDLALYHPDALRDDDELRDAMRYNNVFTQATQTNFEPAIGSMFADAFYNQDDKFWQEYNGFREMWV